VNILSLLLKKQKVGACLPSSLKDAPSKIYLTPQNFLPPSLEAKKNRLMVQAVFDTLASFARLSSSGAKPDFCPNQITPVAKEDDLNKRNDDNNNTERKHCEYCNRNTRACH